MQPFIDRNVLLTTKTSRLLYHFYAKRLPIADRLMRFSANEIAADRVYNNISEFWLEGESGRRILRLCGADDAFFAQTPSDYDRFRLLCTAMPGLVGNPIYLLCHLSLLIDFDCSLPITPDHCDAIWALTAERLADEPTSPSRLLARRRVEQIGVLASPEAALCKAEPVFAPFDKELLDLTRPEFLRRLRAIDKDIADLPSLEKVLNACLDRLTAEGCCSAFHALKADKFVRPDPYHADLILKRALRGDIVSADERDLFTAQLLRSLGRAYCRHSMTLYLRSTALPRELISYLQNEDALPRTRILCADPAEIASAAEASLDFPHALLMMTYAKDTSPEEMGACLRKIASLSSIGRMGGFVSNADSPLTLLYHDYFRRILCRTLGEWMEEGRCPYDLPSAVELICDICYNNSRK